MQALRQLEVLFIPGTFLSERGLHALAALPRLQTLGLECFAEGSPSYLSTLSCLTQLTALQVSLGAPLPPCPGDCLPTDALARDQGTCVAPKGCHPGVWTLAACMHSCHLLPCRQEGAHSPCTHTLSLPRRCSVWSLQICMALPSCLRDAASDLVWAPASLPLCRERAC